jgi:hypothetical protein
MLSAQDEADHIREILEEKFGDKKADNRTYKLLEPLLLDAKDRAIAQRH